ncbi:MAG: aromatic aminobenezylarsenical efflux permease ArsG family transporter [Dehalococcoidales bacterium]|nr:aromatic aminobenezylarsenical efflux permease ArsG family transporter [Dehalococcoidales bacterium]
MDFGGLISGSSGILGTPAIAAFSLGLLTAISPCPLATNIAAIAYISRGVTERRYAVTASALYTLGRMVAYSVLGFLIIRASLEIPGAAMFLQDTGEKVLGPILIAVGVILLNVHRFRFIAGGSGMSSLGARLSRWGKIGAFLLGIVFALAFCPYSAVLYFGTLIPLSLKSTGGVALPAVFAIGTGLPVLIFGISLSFGITRVSSWFEKLTRAQGIIRIVTSWVLIGIGVYYLILWLQAG